MSLVYKAFCYIYIFIYISPYTICDCNVKGYIHYLVIYVNTWTLKSTQMSNLPYSQTLSFLFASFMRNINKTGRTVEKKFLGVIDDELLLLFIFQPTLYMHHRVKSGSFDIAIKKRSPLDCSALWIYPSHNNNEHFPLLH